MGGDLYHTGSLIIALQVLSYTLEIGTEAETHKIECLYFSRVYTNEKNREREKDAYLSKHTEIKCMIMPRVSTRHEQSGTGFEGVEARE